MNRLVRYVRLKLRQWGNDLERVPGLGKLVAKSKVISLPGLQKVPLYDVMRFFGQSMSKGVVFQRAAAITYRVFIAVIPMIIALFSAIAFLGEDFRNTLISLLQSVVPPYAWPAVEGVITDVVMRQNGTLSSLMFVIGVYFTIVCIMGILAAMTTSYFNEDKRNFLQQIKLSAMLMILTFIIIVFVASFFIVASLVIREIHSSFMGGNPNLYSFVVNFLKWVLVFAAVYFLISIFYYLAPVKRGNYRFFSAGSSTCTLLLVILLGVVNLYFSNFTNYNLIYGSLGALFAILLWINWSSTIFLICYDLNVSIAKAKSENKQLSDHLEEEITDSQQDKTPKQ